MPVLFGMVDPWALRLLQYIPYSLLQYVVTAADKVLVMG